MTCTSALAAWHTWQGLGLGPRALSICHTVDLASGWEQRGPEERDRAPPGRRARGAPPGGARWGLRRRPGPSPARRNAAHLGCSAGGRQARRSDATCGHFPLYVERCQPAARARRGQCVCHTRDTSERTSKGAKGHSKGHALLSRQTERQSLEPLSSLPPPPRERFTGSFTKRSPAPLKYQLSPQLKLKCHTEAC